MSRRRKFVWISVLVATLGATVGIPSWVRDVAFAIDANNVEIGVEDNL